MVEIAQAAPPAFHVEEAERLITLADQTGPELGAFFLQMAQVHAQLANATALIQLASGLCP